MVENVKTNENVKKIGENLKKTNIKNGRKCKKMYQNVKNGRKRKKTYENVKKRIKT